MSMIKSITSQATLDHLGSVVNSTIFRATCVLMLFSSPMPQVAAQGSFLEEVIVTARRYEENLQDVPVSVSSMTGAYLQEQNLSNVRDIIDFSPGGVSTSFNKMQDEYSLRGISSQTEGSSGDSSVATVIDNVVISREFMKSQAFFDMESVEILRGPQGTSFGRNASSGLIHLKTAKPDQEFGAGITAGAGTYGAYNLEGYVTGNLSDNLAGRIAFNFDTLDGYVEDVDAGPSSAGVADSNFGDGLGGEENISIRGSLLFNPSDNLEIYLKAQYSKDDDSNPTPRKGQDCTIFYQAHFEGDDSLPSVVGAPQPGWTQYPDWFDSCDPWETSISNPTYLGEFFLEREIFTLTGEITWEVADGLTVTSVTGYLNGDSDYLIDAHGGPNDSMFQSTQNDAWQFSQELRIDNHASGNQLRWLAGIYYLTDDQDRHDQNIFYVNDSVGDPQPASGFRPEGRDIKQQINETDSLGIFGEINYDVSDRVNVTVGARWSQDEKEYGVAHYGWGWGGPIDGLTNGIDANGDGNLDEVCVFGPAGPPTWGDRFCGSPANPVGFETPVRTSANWDNISFKGSLSYAFTDDHMAYFLYSEGYKTGGFQNEPFNPTDALIPYNEETVRNYELGFKGTFAGRFRLNASLFIARYDDLQMFLFINSPTGDFNQVTKNGPEVEIFGIEIDYVWQITDNLRLSGSYANIDSEFGVDVLNDDGSVAALAGTRPDNTPEWTGTAILEYTWRLDNGSFALRGDWRGLSNVFDDIAEDPNREHDAYSVVGIRGTWRSADDKWSVSAYGANLFEEAYTINVGPGQPNINQLNFMYGPPRTFGGTVSYRY